MVVALERFLQTHVLFMQFIEFEQYAKLSIYALQLTTTMGTAILMVVMSADEIVDS